MISNAVSLSRTESEDVAEDFAELGMSVDVSPEQKANFCNKVFEFVKASSDVVHEFFEQMH